MHTDGKVKEWIMLQEPFEKFLDFFIVKIQCKNCEENAADPRPVRKSGPETTGMSLFVFF